MLDAKMATKGIPTILDFDRDVILKGISGRDPVMKSIVERVGAFDLKVGGDYFESLVESIVYQQLAGSAADSIYRKLKLELGSRVSPESLSALKDEQFRKAGISPQKLRYLRDLSSKALSGELDLNGIEALDDDAISARLTSVKGIGTWTAQMFLIFTLGRTDVLPTGDLGIQNAMKKHYSIRGKVTEKRMHRIASKWSPYRTAAVWYLWRSMDIKLPAAES